MQPLLLLLCLVPALGKFDVAQHITKECRSFSRMPQLRAEMEASAYYSEAHEAFAKGSDCDGSFELFAFCHIYSCRNNREVKPLKPKDKHFRTLGKVLGCSCDAMDGRPVKASNGSDIDWKVATCTCSAEDLRPVEEREEQWKTTDYYILVTSLVLSKSAWLSVGTLEDELADFHTLMCGFENHALKRSGKGMLCRQQPNGIQGYNAGTALPNDL